MKQTLLLSIVLTIFLSAFAQSNQWTWISGDNSADQSGIYGIKGVAGAANKPGSRALSTSWMDASGNFWLFGGSGYITNANGLLNDLWKYTVLTGQWTWMGGSNTLNPKGVYGTRGVANAANIPSGRRDCVGWTDAAGNFWLYGGQGYVASGAGSLGDLWKYSPATNLWTWMSGDTLQNQPSVYGIQGISAAANTPGARDFATSGGTADAAGNLWLFGGLGYGTSPTTGGIQNDLWKYSIPTGQWTWVSGAHVSSQPAVYGSKGAAAPSNRPGARMQSVGWTDVSGNFWLFGTGFATTNFSRNDLWKYDVSTGLWTWLSGDSTLSQGGIYGTKGMAASANTPGARSSATARLDRSGNLLLFGGWGYRYTNQDSRILNDLWSYSPVSGQWTWLSGDSTLNAYGQYGTKGTSAPSNKPGARFWSVSGIDASNNLWIFGGSGLAASTGGYLNDLWKYTVASTSILGSVNGFIAQKESQTVTLSWSSSPDQNLHSFVVERYNGTVTGYQIIGTVPASGGSSRYSFTDNTPLPGTNFYRIRQIDQSGSVAYSSTAQVDMSQYATQFSVYQNPVQNILQLVVQLPMKQKLTLQVRDMNGHVLIQQEQIGYPGRASFSVPVDRLNKGTYLIQVGSENINSTKTFIKQ